MKRNTAIKPMGLCLTVLLAGCGAGEVRLPPEPNLTAAYAEVRDFIRERRAAVQRQPDSATAWGEYALALDAHEFDAEAIQAYQLAVRLDPTAVRWKYLLATKLQRDQPEQAGRLLSELAGSETVTLPMLLRHADLLADQGQTRALKDVLQQAEARAPDHPAVLFRLAQVAFQEARLDHAEAFLDRIGSSYQETDRLRARIAVARGQTPRPISTEASVSQTLSDPAVAEVMDSRRDPLYRGRLAAEEARRGSRLALMTLEGLVRRHPELVDNRLELALILHANGGSRQAAQLLEAGLKSHPDSERLLAGRATVAILSEDWSTAEAQLSRLVEVAPTSASGWADLGFVLEQQGRPAEARAAYQRSLKLRPDEELQQRLEQFTAD